MKKFVRVFAIGAFCGLVCTAFAAEPAARQLKADGVVATFSAKDGLQITVDGVPFSLNSSFNVMSTDWTRAWYTNEHDKTIDEQSRVEPFGNGGSELILPVSESEQVVSGTRTIKLLPGRKLSIKVDIKRTSDVTLRLEHRIGALDAGWLAGCSWHGVLRDGKTTSGRTAAVALHSELELSAILKGIKKFTVDSLGGEVEISASGNAAVSLIDYRKNQWANGLNYYWFGVLSNPIPDKGLHYEVVLQLPQRIPGSRKKWSAAFADITTSPLVMLAEQAVDEIVPTPKDLKWGDGVLKLKGPAEISWDGENAKAAFETSGGVELITKMAEGLFGSAAAGGSGGKSKIYISADSFASLKNVDGKPIDKALRQEAYTLRVDSQIRISAGSSAGVLNALKSLGQIVRKDSRGNISVRKCAVTDFPSLPFRGVHFFTGKGAKDIQTHMVRDVLGPLKINELVYQCDYLNWASSPVLRNPEFGMDTADAVAVADTAKAEGIDVIPLVNTFGHSEWLLDYPQMRHLSDNPDYPFAYDPSNPEVYRLCDAIYKEAINLFHPKTMHIGHDEIDFEGFPSRPANKAMGTTALIRNDIRHYHDLLSGMGIKTMMWGDMLLANGESPDATLAKSVDQAKERRAALPKDITIADWHYAPAKPETFKSLKILNDAGFKAVACTWDTRANIINFTKAAVTQHGENPDCLGLLQTTWAGYNFDEKGFRSHVDQYAAYVMAAQAAWTGAVGSDAETFDYQRVFARLWNSGVLPSEECGGWTVDLETSNPVSLSGLADRFGWNKSAVQALMNLKGEIGRFRFFAEKGGSVSAVLMSGRFNGPDAVGVSEVTIPVKRSADNLAIAIAATVSATKGEKLGTMQVVYADGKSEVVPLIMGENICAVTDDSSSLYSPVLWSVPGENEIPALAIHGLFWKNQRVGTEIDHVRFRSANSGSSLMIFGMAGIEIPE